MKTSLFAGLNTAVRAMQTAQFALNVHGSNIAHANDAAYTRRQVTSATERGSLGPGIIRIRDAFVDDQYRQSSGKLGEAEIRHEVMGLVEGIFGDPVDGGLRQATDNFFDAWRGLAENPSDDVARLQVLSQGRSFAQQISSVYAQLTAVEQRVNEQLASRVTEVNTELQKVYDLNVRISGMQPSSGDDAALRDGRDAALDRLAKLTGAIALPDDNGTVRVIVGPTPVVDGPTLIKLKLVDDGSGVLVPTWAGYNTPNYGGRGTLSGLLELRETDLATLKRDIDTLGRTVAQKVNDLHRTGTGLLGDTNLDFFLIGGGPANVVVNPDLQPHQIAAGGGTGLPGDGEMARQLANLADDNMLESAIIPGQFQPPRTFFRNMVGWIGSRTQEAAQLKSIAETHIMVGQQQRSERFGVSLDEEVAYLSVQQKAFAAAARVITTMDEMLDTLINRTFR